MGFLKKLGRLAKKGVRFAASSGLVPGAGAVAGVLASRLQTAGENRRKLALARKGQLVQKPTSYLTTATGKPDRAPAWKKAPLPTKPVAQIKLNAMGQQLVSGTVAAKREASIKRLASVKDLELRIAKLTPGQKEDLAERFKREGGGSPADFRAFLNRNV